MDPSVKEKVKHTAAVLECNYDKLREFLDAATAEELNDKSGPCNDPQGALRILCRQPDALPLVKLFIEKGADINFCECSSSGSTPLAAACFGGCEETARYLLEQGANPNVVDVAGESAYSFASAEPCKLLLMLHGAEATDEEFNE